jgi:hypothetical protein
MAHHRVDLAAQRGDERLVRSPVGDRPSEALLEVFVLFESN